MTLALDWRKAFATFSATVCTPCQTRIEILPTRFSIREPWLGVRPNETPRAWCSEVCTALFYQRNQLLDRFAYVWRAARTSSMQVRHRPWSIHGEKCAAAGISTWTVAHTRRPLRIGAQATATSPAAPHGAQRTSIDSRVVSAKQWPLAEHVCGNYAL